MSTEAVDAGTRPEAHHFQAEVTELLRLMVHAVYSETEVFLRELISNGSDACDKLRYEAIAKPELLADGAALAIRIKPDAAAGTLTITDTGIGMDRQELIDNLGTVARSGTRAFVQPARGSQGGRALIGKFGVGFYSAFMVADRIEVTSRRAGASEAFVWRSAGGEGFEISPATASRRRACRAARRSSCTSRRTRSAFSKATRSSASSRPIRTTSSFRSSSSARKARRSRSTPRARSGSGRSPSSRPRTTRRPIAPSPALSTSRP